MNLNKLYEFKKYFSKINKSNVYKINLHHHRHYLQRFKCSPRDGTVASVKKMNVDGKCLKMCSIILFFSQIACTVNETETANAIKNLLNMRRENYQKYKRVETATENQKTTQRKRRIKKAFYVARIQEIYNHIREKDSRHLLCDARRSHKLKPQHLKQHTISNFHIVLNKIYFSIFLCRERRKNHKNSNEILV